MAKRDKDNELKIPTLPGAPMRLPKDPATRQDDDEAASSSNGAPGLLGSGEEINIFVADDTEMGTQLLADALRRSHHFQVITAPQDAMHLHGATFDREPQVALISSSLDRSGMKGLDLSRQLRNTFPDVRVIILLDHSTRESVLEAFKAGAQGVFCRNGSLKLLRKCILCVHAGQVWASSNEMHFLLESLFEVRVKPLVDARGMKLLSKREEDVLYCAVDGLKNREIAAQLHLSEHTIKNYMFRIFDKLGVSSRVEMILYALSQRPAPSSAGYGYEFVQENGDENHPRPS